MIFLLWGCSVQSATPSATSCNTPGDAFGEGAWVYGLATQVYSPGKKKEATEAVQAAALADLKSKVCTQTLSEAECNSLLGYRYTGRNTPYFDEANRTVCASVGIKKDLLTQYTPERVKVEAELDQAIYSLRLKLPFETPVDVLPVQTLSGCSVPELDALAQRVRAGLSGTSIVAGSETRITTQASMNGSTVTVSFELSQSGTTRFSSKPVSFPGAFYSLTGIPSLCREDAMLGLYGGRRQGDVGVTLSTDLLDSGVCTGEIFKLTVSTTLPARVHVFSVAPDGQAWHIWPKSLGEKVEGTRLLTEVIGAPLSEGGDESLVAVAVPQNASANELDAMAGYCKLKKPFTDKLYPAGAAVSRLSWHIETRDCPPVTDPSLRPEAIAAALAAAPACP